MPPQGFSVWLGPTWQPPGSYPTQKLPLQLSHPILASHSNPAVHARSNLSATGTSCLWRHQWRRRVHPGRAGPGQMQNLHPNELLFSSYVVKIPLYMRSSSPAFTLERGTCFLYLWVSLDRLDEINLSPQQSVLLQREGYKIPWDEIFPCWV